MTGQAFNFMGRSVGSPAAETKFILFVDEAGHGESLSQMLQSPLSNSATASLEAVDTVCGDGSMY